MITSYSACVSSIVWLEEVTKYVLQERVDDVRTCDQQRREAKDRGRWGTHVSGEKQKRGTSVINDNLVKGLH